MFQQFLGEIILRAVLLGLLLAVPLAACSTTTPAQRFAAMETSCKSYGFKPGTESYGNCMMQKDMANAQQDAANQERIRGGLRALGRAIAAPPTPAPSMVTCHTNGTARNTYGTVYGNSTTTCF